MQEAAAAVAPKKQRKGKKSQWEMDHPDERDAAQTAVLKAVHRAEGKVDERVVGVDLDGRSVTVSLRKLSGDGKHWLGVRFTYRKEDSALHDKEGEEVRLRDVSVLDYISWLKDRRLDFLKNEAKRVTGERPTGNQGAAIAHYLGSLYQLELSEGKDCRALLESRIGKRKALANLRLSDSEYALLSVAPEEITDRQLSDLARRSEQPEGDIMNGDANVAAELNEKREVVDVKALKAEAVAKKAKAAKPAKAEKAAEPKAEPKAEAKKTAAKKPAAKKAEAKKPAAKEERKVLKLSDFEVGMKVKYRGRNKAYRGRTMEILSKNKQGVFVKMGDAVIGCSPNSFERA